MNERHRKFAQEYVRNGGNGVQAVIAAGYKLAYGSACVRASLLLRSVKVKAMIDKPYQKGAEAADLTAERVMREIAKVAFTDVEVDTAAKMKGLDLASKVLGLQVQKIESTDTTERDASVTALTTHIESVAATESVSLDSAAVGLFTRLSATHHPTLSNPAAWGKWQGVIEKSIADAAAQREQPVIDAGDQ